MIKAGLVDRELPVQDWCLLLFQKWLKLCDKDRNNMTRQNTTVESHGVTSRCEVFLSDFHPKWVRLSPKWNTPVTLYVLKSWSFFKAHLPYLVLIWPTFGLSPTSLLQWMFSPGIVGLDPQLDKSDLKKPRMCPIGGPLTDFGAKPTIPGLVRRQNGRFSVWVLMMRV